ncbi:hypothetical protein CASFOL_004444 [Castilleja foliolosa]|uniref:Kinesin motor domain-containing protein n=1 Tax=Castilleja foliolosa TaxID=1961234 RepID=A0ABD3ECI8_9LAMI
MTNSGILPRSCSTSPASFYAGAGDGSRFITASQDRGGYPRSRTPVSYPSVEDQLAVEPRLGDGISVTIRFRPSEREYQRVDEIASYPDDDDDDNPVRKEYNPMTDKVFMLNIAAPPVVKASLEGSNGTIFAYCVTSSGKTHIMHTKITGVMERMTACCELDSYFRSVKIP